MHAGRLGGEGMGLGGGEIHVLGIQRLVKIKQEIL